MARHDNIGNVPDCEELYLSLFIFHLKIVGDGHVRVTNR